MRGNNYFSWILLAQDRKGHLPAAPEAGGATLQHFKWEIILFPKILCAKRCFSPEPNRCLGVTAMEPDVFHPFRPFEMKELWWVFLEKKIFPWKTSCEFCFRPLEKKETRTASDWEKKTKKALAVHFFSFMTKWDKGFFCTPIVVEFGY